jgi:hypothetical protein
MKTEDCLLRLARLSSEFRLLLVLYALSLGPVGGAINWVGTNCGWSNPLIRKRYEFMEIYKPIRRTMNKMPEPIRFGFKRYCDLWVPEAALMRWLLPDEEDRIHRGSIILE